MILSSSILTRRKILVGMCFVALTAGGGYFYCFHQTEAPNQVFRHFRKAERIEFCTMKPELDSNELPEDFGYGDIEGYSIVDRVYLKSQGSVINAVVWADRMNNSKVAACFNPRHAIRDAEDENNYLLICFECMQMRYRLNGETGSVLISQGQACYFERLVKKHSMTRAADLRRD